MKKIIAALFMATLLITACKSSKETIQESAKEVAAIEQWIIASAKVKCDEDIMLGCYQIKKSGSAAYESMNVQIEGFNYELGYKYQIEVKVVPSKKMPTKYVFVKELVKIASK